MFFSKKKKAEKPARSTREGKRKERGTKGSGEVSDKSEGSIKLYYTENDFITVKIGNCAHQGARDYQEDSFGYSNIIDSDVISEKGFVAVLADGMGGLSNGKEISSYVVSAFIEMFNALSYDAPFPPQLERMVESINSEVCRNFCEGGKSGAGSTIVAAFTYKTNLYWVCTGDSRLYLKRGCKLYVANEDHDYFNQLLPELMHGETSMERISNDEQKDALTSYIGCEKLPFIDVSKRGFAIHKEDALVLCSDGIYNAVSDAEIINILAQNEPQAASEEIVQAVLNKNIAGQDNLTVMVIKFE